MDAFILLLVERYGGMALIGGIVLYLVIEGALDIGTDLISHEIIKRKEKEPE